MILKKENRESNLFYKKIIILVILLIVTSMYYYIDVNSNIRHGMNIWKSLFDGEFFKFYSVNLEARDAGLVVHEANYGIFQYFVIGVWQLPLFIIEKIFGGNVLNYAVARIWGKSYLLVALCISCRYLKKIARNLGVEERYLDYVVMFFMSSAITMFCLCNVGQTDIVAVTFTLVAFWYLFTEDGNKHFLNIKFIVFFTLASLCKDFALFIFIPVILYKEKNLIKIALNSCIPVIVSFIIELPFKIVDKVGTSAKSPRLWNMIAKMMENRINLMGVDVPILLLIFVSICMIAYIMHTETGLKAKRWMLFWGYLSILTLFLSTYTYPYWLIYVLPFTVLFFFMNSDRIFQFWLLDCIASCSIVVGFMVEFAFIFGNSNLSFIEDNADVSQGMIVRFSEFIKANHYHNVWALAYAVFIVWTLILAVLNCPVYVEKKELKGEKLEFSTKELKCSFELLLWLRMIASFILCILPVIFYFLKK